MKKLILLISIALATYHCSNIESGISTDEFKNPSTEYRPLALWSWMNGFVDTNKVVYELEQMKAKGMRGGIIWDLGAISDPENMIPAGPPFLGPESLEYLSVAMKKGAELGLDIGMAVSSSWNAGGSWIGPEDAIKEVLLTSQVVKGPGKVSLKIIPPQKRMRPIEHYSLISSVAMPYSASKNIDGSIVKAVNLDKLTTNSETINWDVPEGEWEVFSFFSCNTMQPLVIPSPNSRGLMIDHLNHDATRKHFDSLFSRLPDFLMEERLIKFMEIDSYEVDMMKDWSPNLVTEFKSRYKYDPVPYIPLLLGYNLEDSIVAERFRADYARLVSDMMIENHFSQSVEIADKYSIQMVTEAGHGGSPRVDPLKALGHSHIPTGEYWNRKQFWVTKEAASAAHIYGLKLVASESLTGWQHWQHGPSDYKQLTDIALCEGLNQIMFHTFAHNPEVAGKPGFTYHAGEHLNVNTTWWEMAKPFMDYLGRCSYMLRQGLFVADACLYYGDQAPNLVPPKRIDPNIEPLYDDDHCLHCGQPKSINPGPVPGYDYDYMNAEIIVRDMTVVDGKITLPSGMSYRVIMLPDKESINLDVLRKLDELVYQGAVILGSKPSRTTSLENYPGCDEEVKSLADKIWGDCDGISVKSNSYGQGKVYCGLSLMEVLEDLGIPKDFEVKGIDNNDMHIDYIHRQNGNLDIYFISNSNQSTEEFSAVFRVDKKRKVEIWDPLTGLVQREVEYTKSDNGLELKLIMDPLVSLFIVFPEKSSGKNDEGLHKNFQFSGFLWAGEKISQSKIDLSSNWTVSFDPSWGGPAAYPLEKLVSWPSTDDEGVKYYSGKAVYKKQFELDEGMLDGKRKFVVKFSNIQETARVKVNGIDCGILWTPPYEAEISEYLRAGENELLVEVINTWNNRLVGDVLNPDKTQFTNTNIKNKFSHGNLLDSGITGDAEIYIIENQK